MGKDIFAKQNISKEEKSPCNERRVDGVIDRRADRFLGIDP